MISVFLRFLVRLYQIFLSPLFVALGVSCRFYPTCSRYAMSCLDQDPWPRAIVKIFSRLKKCGPWHPGGIDLP